MQNNTLYLDKILFCIKLNTTNSYNEQNKKVSKELKRLTYSIELPNEEFKNELQILAKKKGLTQKAFTEKIFINYAIQEKKRQTEQFFRNFREDKREGKEFFKEILSIEQRNEIKQLVINAYKLARSHSDNELLYFKEYIQDYINDFEFKFKKGNEPFSLKDFDNFSKKSM